MFKKMIKKIREVVFKRSLRRQQRRINRIDKLNEITKYILLSRRKTSSHLASPR